MHENIIDSCCFENIVFDPMIIVDNDVINYCSVLEKDSISKKDWKRLNKLYKDGERDINCCHFDSLGNVSFNRNYE